MQRNDQVLQLSIHFHTHMLFDTAADLSVNAEVTTTTLYVECSCLRFGYISMCLVRARISSPTSL